jgi:glycosyltransferase involved in cell wall biosynthesis
MADVTIGMPLFSNSSTLATALDSLLAQTVQDVRLIVSDDCSGDDTASICEAYARRDSRIDFVRQTKNLGYANFKFVLDRADTPFFMWAAGDDRWAPTFVEQNLRALKSDPTLVGSVSKVCFEADGKPLRPAMGTYPLLGSVEENIARFLSAPHDNSRQYGLFRTEVLRRAFPSESFHAYDWALLAATLLHGKHNELSEVLMFRDFTPASHYNALVRRDHSQLVLRLFPLLRMTRWLISTARIPLTRPTVLALLALNIDRHYQYCEVYHPRYFRITARLRNYLSWKLRSLQSRTRMMG